MTQTGGLLVQYDYPQRPAFRSLRRWRRPISTMILIALVVLIHVGPSSKILPASTTPRKDFLEGLHQCHEVRNRTQRDRTASTDRHNPRWNPISGQKQAIIIQNATLFDGDSTHDGLVDIILDAGVIRSVLPTQLNNPVPDNARVINVQGRFITPGLVDMHSHHLLLPFPKLPSTSDVNERPLLGPITPFVRALDGFKPYDPAIKIIASGGVTSSLVLPGSANIVGGEAYLVKNLPRPGPHGEPVVEELLLEDGRPESDRQRYLKMACGENPKGVYGNTRLGLAWLLREQLEKARQLLDRQSAWCDAAFAIEETPFAQSHRISSFLEKEGKRPESLEFETLLALLRGELNVNVHCYEPEDFERMAAVLHEFGVHPQAFHHALEAWQVPELLKNLEENITIATFAENALFKAEAYGANLRGPKILDDHGVKVALKSDHTGEWNYAKDLIHQASVAHSFGLSEEKSLQSVTSVPARSIQQDHRIGYVRPGYDADLVIWDDHPLQVGATPIEVFIDGRALLEHDGLGELAERTLGLTHQAPAVRPLVSDTQRDDTCAKAQRPNARVLFTGIKRALVDIPDRLDHPEDLVLLVDNDKVACFNKKSACVAHYKEDEVARIELNNGYVTPGLVAFANNLGIQAIPPESSTGDGTVKSQDLLNEQKSVHFAKYGVHLHGKAFTRARIGGVTKAVTPPHGTGILQGVSVGVRTSETATILEGGIWKDNVALHLAIGQSAKDDSTPTISSEIERLRQILAKGQDDGTYSSGIYAQAANGSLPVVVRVFNEDDIAQLILIKRDFSSVKLVIHGGHGAALIAKPLAEAGIPVILSGNHGAPDNWEKKNVLVGPPLSESPAKILVEAGVQLGLAVSSDSSIHGLAREARWAGKYAGLSDEEAIALVSTNIEDILGVRERNTGGSQAYGDLVVWEGDPLRGEGSVVLSIQEDGRIADCWPDTVDAIL
ncbi:hypothetical protein P170DRAFT_454922 [Aspergillus steynii IBT 23096]|uniref:Amidohydrolase-related domain-containing protein n=1 Tax=Aspergillus steynii IBT 23096 TaxID=1392250 RepID=A0A2I2GBX5_9EURO|nr:uncharacterized protein P170DRAFT_454922 [Aspergillus steynii IBT 23096]PLB50380.1 hypothetical protein P170DRAFT_454922 [Aspergillus steynii IBT 23096]